MCRPVTTGCSLGDFLSHIIVTALLPDAEELGLF
jgi:hypothetical protein